MKGNMKTINGLIDEGHSKALKEAFRLMHDAGNDPGQAMWHIMNRHWCKPRNMIYGLWCDVLVGHIHVRVHAINDNRDFFITFYSQDIQIFVEKLPNLDDSKPNKHDWLQLSVAIRMDEIMSSWADCFLNDKTSPTDFEKSN